MFNLLSKLVLKKYNPIIVGIISDGKTNDARKAVCSVLGFGFSARENIIKEKKDIFSVVLCLKKDYSVSGFFYNFLNVFKAVFLKINYPEILILEIPISNAKKMNYFINLFTPYLKTVVIFSEKNSVKESQNFQSLIKFLNNGDKIILNYKNTEIKKIAKFNKIQVLTFGLNETTDIKATDILIQTPQEIKPEIADKIFISFKVVYQGKTVPVRLFKTLDVNQVFSALGAVGAGIAFEKNLVEISEALKKYHSPAGRMKIIEGIKHSLIIDNTGNADLNSVFGAIDVMFKFEKARRIAVLGDIAFSNFYEKECNKAGRKAAKIADLIFTIGFVGKFVKIGAVEAGMDKEKIFEFLNAEKAGRELQKKIKQGDVILVNGSKKARMEKIVKEIMAEPNRASELLVRQNEGN